MADAGAFNDRARAAIYEIGGHRCIGCGRTDLSAQHRRPRGGGGTTDVTIGHPANGVPLCGDGTRGCHGWAERFPRAAMLLGWRLEHGQLALEAPFWSRGWEWRVWIEDETGFVGVAYVDVDEDLDQAAERLDVVVRFTAWRHAA